MKTFVRVGVFSAAFGTAVAAVVAGAAFAATPAHAGTSIALTSATSTPTPTASATPAPSGSGSSDLSKVRANGATATSKRIASLNAEISKVNADTSLSSSEKSTVLSALNKDLTGMKTLASEISSASTTTAARNDLKEVRTEYRVYAVGIRQARLAAWADRTETVTIPKVVAEQKRLSTRLSGKDAAKSTSTLTADLSDMSTQLQAAQTAASSVASSALAVTPAQYTANPSVFQAVLSSKGTATAALKKAHSDASSVRTALH